MREIHGYSQYGNVIHSQYRLRSLPITCSLAVVGYGAGFIWWLMKKHDLPAMMWYWGDWFKALDVQSLPREIRCTWFEMIGKMHESSEYGILLVNGKPPEKEMLARMLGFGENIDLLNHHLNLLDNYGVYSKRESDGAIYCRRMVHDADVREKRRKAGQKGGNPLLLDNHLVKQQDNQIPENENETEKNKPLRVKKSYAEAVSMFPEEYSKLRAKNSNRFVQACITELNNYKMSSGKKYKSDYHAIMNWVIDKIHAKFGSMPDPKKIEDYQVPEKDRVDPKEIKKLFEGIIKPIP